MNIDCEIGIRGDTCQCSALSLGCRQARGRYHGATVAFRHSSSLKAATFPLYLPGEACLPFSGLIFLLEQLTIYLLLPSPPFPLLDPILSLISSPFCAGLFFLLVISLLFWPIASVFVFFCGFSSRPFSLHGVVDMDLSVQLK